MWDCGAEKFGHLLCCGGAPTYNNNVHPTRITRTLFVSLAVAELSGWRVMPDVRPLSHPRRSEQSRFGPRLSELSSPIGCAAPSPCWVRLRFAAEPATTLRAVR